MVSVQVELIASFKFYTQFIKNRGKGKGERLRTNGKNFQIFRVEEHQMVFNDVAFLPS